MVAPTFKVSRSSSAAPLRDTERLRYRLDVVACSVADLIQSAGGWLYDRAMAGWEVTALLPDGCDDRALRILGVRGLGLEERFATLGTGSTSHTLAVSAEALSVDTRVRDTVLRSLDDRMTEVALWGRSAQEWPLRVNRLITRSQHRLSAAARTFKGYALAAEGVSGITVDPVEALLCDVRSPIDTELIRLD
ncbi:MULTISPECIES: hypothetical protein [unclassified Mycobacterium]|uniref:hypothetical protein n=1 Tax=unclassified Mycobacterium TaxID=2642494 RepID=UPI0008018546|nr:MULTISPECIES: hypothetical protein [unclassified Mycobacterium]OBG73874.1 hypothetical protein A5700_05820 [Mycobacterium sp. E1214]OBH28474.1 hypothetical protein A5693_02185 [Mycobacterium sp. E1319]